MYGTLEGLGNRVQGHPFTADTDDARRALTYLEDVSVLIDVEAGPARVALWANPGPVPPICAVVALRAAERAFRNPDGAVQRGAGTFNQGFAWTAAQGVYLSDAEKALLQDGFGDDGGDDRSLQSVEMIGEYSEELQQLYVQDNMPGSYDPILYAGRNDPWGGPLP